MDWAATGRLIFLLLWVFLERLHTLDSGDFCFSAQPGNQQAGVSHSNCCNMMIEKMA
jgi:hypothetical protein